MTFDLGYEPHGMHDPRPGFRGTSLQEFHRFFPDSEACLRHLFLTRFGKAPDCTKCAKAGDWYRISGTRRFQHPCGKGISPQGQTLFHQTNLPLHLWFYTMLHFSNSSEGVNSRFLGRHLGISPSHAHGMARKIRLQMAALDMNEKIGQAGRPVVVRLEKLDGFNINSPGGQNSATAFFVADERCVQSTIVGRARPSVLSQTIKRKVAAGAIPITDCSWTYRALSNCGTRKPRAQMVPSYMVSGPGHPDTIRSFLSHCQRPMRNNYRRVDKTYIWMYLKEFEFRYNRRHRSHEIFRDMVSAFPSISTANPLDLIDWNSVNSDGSLSRVR